MVCLFAFFRPSRKFFTHGDVININGEGLQWKLYFLFLRLCWYSNNHLTFNMRGERSNRLHHHRSKGWVKYSLPGPKDTLCQVCPVILKKKRKMWKVYRQTDGRRTTGDKNSSLEQKAECSDKYLFVGCFHMKTSPLLVKYWKLRSTCMLGDHDHFVSIESTICHATISKVIYEDTSHSHFFWIVTTVSRNFVCCDRN